MTTISSLNLNIEAHQKSTSLPRVLSSNQQFSISETNIDVKREMKVIWKATVLVNLMENSPYRTINHDFPPKLAQDEPKFEDLPPTFKNPLANLRLDDKEDILTTFCESNKHETKSKTFSRVSQYGNRCASSKQASKKKYLHTTPNKYLPIPVLTRNAYFYSYGRCPTCSGNIQIKTRLTSSSRNSEFERELNKLTEKRYCYDGSNSCLKNEKFEHLEGRNIHRISDGRSESCCAKIDDQLRMIQAVEQETPDRLPSEITSGTSTLHCDLPIAASQSPDFYIKDSDIASLGTFASANYDNKTIKSKSKTVSAKTTYSQCLKVSKEKFTPRNQLKPNVKDLKGMLPGAVILASKIKDYDIHIPLISLNTADMRELYTVTILKDNSLKRLFSLKNLDNLPEELKYLKTIKMSNFPDDSMNQKVLDADVDKDNQFRIPMSNTAKSILTEIANQFYEADFLVLGLFTNWLERARQDAALFQLKTPKEFAKLFQMLGEELYYNATNPASCTRLELLYVLTTASNEPRLRHHLWLHTKCWLEPLMSSLLADRLGTREESCYTLAFLFSNNVLVEDMRHNLQLDIPFDVTAVVIRAMEYRPESFMYYFCLLGYMLEGCPSYSILNCIAEKGAISKNPLFRQRWPLFHYYAFRHWASTYLYVDPLYPKRAAEAAEKAFMDPISRKAARLALTSISIRSKSIVQSITIWLPEWLNTE